MAKKLTDLTIDFTKMRRIPVQERVQLAKSQAASDIFGNMTPSQIAALFPKYYQEKMPDLSGFRNATASRAAREGWTGYNRNGRTGSGDVVQPRTSGGGSGGGGGDGWGDDTATSAPTAPSSVTDRLLEKAGIKRQPLAGTRESGTGNLEGRKARMKAVYDAYVSAGLSHKQALAITAEVGRENDFSPRFLYGEHQDLNGHTNIGMISMQKDRRDNLIAFLNEKGLIDKDGKIKQGQETLNAQAEFQVREMKEKYPRTAKEFLGNPDIDAESAAVVLGDDYIRWARKGNDKIGFSAAQAAEHDRRRRWIYEEATKVVEDFDPTKTATAEAATPIVPEQKQNELEPGKLPTDGATVSPVPFEVGKLNPDLQTEYNNASPEDKRLIEQAVEKIGIDKANEIRNEKPEASASVAINDIKQEGDVARIRPVASGHKDLLDFWQNRAPRTDLSRLDKVDPVLLKSYAEAAQQYEAANPNYKVEVFGPSSGTRESGSTANHGIKEDGYGKALDFVIIDRATGKQITNLGRSGYGGQTGGSELASQEYTKLHGMARIAQEHFFPDTPNLRQGGGFASGDTAGDWMHGDITGGKMAGFDWKTGYTKEQMDRYRIKQNFALGNEDRIRALGNEIYGEVDDEGYYKNQGAFKYDEKRKVTTVVAQTRPDTQVAQAEPTVEPVPDGPAAPIVPVNPHEKEATPEVPKNDMGTIQLPLDPDANSVPKLALGGIVPNSVDEPLEVRNRHTGEVLAQARPDERISTTPQGLEVESNAKVKAENLIQQGEAPSINDEPEPESDQKAPTNIQGSMSTFKEPPRKHGILEQIANMETPVYSPSAGRALHQATLGSSSSHYNRGTPLE